MTPALPTNLILKHGAHAPGTDMCVMEAVAYIAGEEWTDTPKCASPVIGAFLRSWNDGIPDDATRTRLLTPFIPRLVGSKSTPEVEDTRAWLAVDWSIRVSTPTWLELAGLSSHAEALRALPEVTELTIRDAQPIIAAARAAARDAAGDAARAAARDAAGDAARAAARDAARAAAGAAGWAAARAAAGAATWDALAPTVTTLQESAVNLVNRMLEVTA